ncbi:hypothetical protein B0J11DRAFT_516732 [Dendryphion nanum]|uniref:Uncharacterized protein n=1 Tax=Dendryphion nanum TaxID=256645 RepID=A0A9P9ELT1_9PLEO|nr:hypothetical protein B0J11DRAFT_516732 [Dendryphion nanum]
MFTSASPHLPSSLPHRYMHTVNVDTYNNPEHPDRAFLRHVCPRICDAVATVLFETGEKCLQAFLDPAVQVFEWRRNVLPSNRSSAAVVKRRGHEVAVGTNRTHGFNLFWTLYVKSFIGITGAWTEVCGHQGGTSALPSTTSKPPAPTSDSAPAFKSAEDPLFAITSAPNNNDDHNPMDPKFALYMGRKLGQHLLRWEIWKYFGQANTMVEWEVDGRVTRRVDSDVSNVYRNSAL